MPSPSGFLKLTNIKPKVNITSTQFRALMERVLSRKAKRPFGSPQVEQIQRGMTPQDVTMGRLFEEGPGDIQQVKEFPWVEASIRYRKNPGMYRPDTKVRPPVEHIRSLEPGAFERLGETPSKEDLAKGIAYRRLKYRPVESAADKKVQKVIKREVPNAGKKEVVQVASVLEGLWKEIGGKRTVAGKFWEGLRASSKLHHKIPEAKEYFIWSGLRWLKDPQSFTKQFPREARLLDRLWKEIIEGGVSK